MSMTAPIGQMRIVRDINEAEKALDEALIRHSSLFTTMVSARREVGVEPFAGHAGHEALLRLARSQQHLLDAGGDLARVHGSLLDLQREMGGADSCPPDEPRRPIHNTLAG
jgi:hypothetical protein